MWFHRNALEHDAAYYGVRLSFALAYWRELIGVFPRAGEVLQAVRDETASELLRGEGDSRDLFNDATAIDLELGRTKSTYELFVALQTKEPVRASECADIALPCIVEAGDCDLAMQIVRDPEQYLLGASEQLNENLGLRALPRATARIQRETFVNIYCEDVLLLLRILEGVGRAEWASAAKVWAVALARSASVRRLVESQLAAQPDREHSEAQDAAA
ncbi:hypothetical protein [Polaromonas sp. JS666]|uniref:hypothetical protein n=1 Tax=Polaromonas sp. (strain JS666 / ATCC BAA-500) TaxID=296591 RepID=UPI0012EE85CA|nr:hypothetical protein [Polaromonas sp. JS666]